MSRRGSVILLHTNMHTLEARDMALVRTNITLPAELLAMIDEVAGPRGRSAFIVSVLEKQAKRARAQKIWEENRGKLKDSTTWGRTDAEVLQTLREIRAEWDRPGIWPEDEETMEDAVPARHDAAGRSFAGSARRRRHGAPSVR